MASIKLKVRVGHSYKNPFSEFDAKKNVVVDQITKGAPADLFKTVGVKYGTAISEQLQDYANGAVKQLTLTKVERAVDKIDAAILQDMRRYVSTAVKYFTSRVTSTSGTPLRIDLKAVDKDAAYSKVGFQSTLRYRDLEGATLAWAPLAPVTIRRKRVKGNLNYFINKGNLKKDLGEMLPRFFEAILNPHIKVTYYLDKDLTRASRAMYTPNGSNTRRARPTKFMTIEAVIGTTRAKGLAPSNVSFLSGSITPTKRLERMVLREYLLSRIDELADDVVVKLENAPTRRAPKKQKRPWVEAAMSYWVLKRFPQVLYASLDRHLVKGMK